MKDGSKTSPYGAIRFVPAHFYGSKVPITYMKAKVVTDDVEQSVETTNKEVEQSVETTNEEEQNAMTTDEAEQNTKIVNNVDQITNNT